MSLFMVEPEMIPPGGDESPEPLVLPRPPRVPAEGGWPIMGPSPRPPRPPTSPVASPPPPGPPPELGGPTGPGPPPPPPGGCPPPPTGYMTSVVNPVLAADLSQLPFEFKSVRERRRRAIRLRVAAATACRAAPYTLRRLLLLPAHKDGNQSKGG